MKTRVSGSIALAAALLLAACQVKAPTVAPSTTPKASPGAKASPKADPLPGNRPPEVAPGLVAATLIGKVKLLSDGGAALVSNNSGNLISDAGGTLISDKGLGLIANNGGNLIANNGGGAVSNHGGQLIANNGGGLIGKTKYAVAQAGGLREAALTEAVVEVLDGAGKPVLDAQGKPVQATTDAQGNYKLEAALPAQNLVLRVKVATAGTLKGGELRALVPNPGGEQVAAELDLDTPSTLGATYVLEKYVKGRADVYAKLPAKEADALKRDMGLALQKEARGPAYEAAAINGAVDDLKARNAALGQTLERIESILLLGQTDFGQGLKATAVPLTMPAALAFDAKGDLLIGEAYVGRVRRVSAADGTVTMVAAPRGSSELGYAVPGILAMVQGPDGKTYLIEDTNHRIVRLTPGAKAEVVVGSGNEGHGALGGDPKTVDLNPGGMAFGPDGTLYIGELQGEPTARTRLLAWKDGALTEIPTPEAAFASGGIVAVAAAADGTLYAAISDERTDPTTKALTSGGRLARRKPGEGWTFHHEGLRLGDDAELLLTPDGLLLSEDEGHIVWKLDAELVKTAWAGTGRSGFVGDGGPATAAQLSQPSGMVLAPDGRVLLADRGNALVRAIAKDGTISTVAGLHGLFQQGGGSALAVNNPFGVTIDKNGDLLVAEGASHTIKRFDGKALTVLAGTERGDGGDGGPATAAGFDTPAGMAVDKATGTLYIADYKNERLRKIGPDGTISTVAGSGPRGSGGGAISATLAPKDLSIGRIMNVAIGPDGFPAYTVPNRHQVVKVRPDGQLQLLAGVSFQQGDSKAGDGGDGGPGTEAKMASPQDLVYDAAGNLYVADLGNGRIRKITPDGKIDTYAGLGTLAWLGLPEAVDATTAKEVALALPMSLAIDAAGNLYVGEVGSRNLRNFGIEGADAGVALLLPPAPARIRKIAPDGKVTIIAGPGGKVMTDPEAEDALVLPSSLAVKPDGSLVVSDPGMNQIRLIPAAATK